jgi:hypothetical protein
MENGDVVQIPMSPMGGQVYNPQIKLLNRMRASGYDLCIEDVMETIRRANEEGFVVVQSS